MAPSNPQLISQWRQFIWYHLDNDLVDNALFFAGRLHALDSRNPDSVHLLALCHFRAGQIKIAYDYCRHVTSKKDHPGCAYVFAQVCLALERYAEGVAVLERTRSIWESRAPLGKIDPQRRPMPDAAAFHCVLGKLAHGNGDRQKAIDSYVAALKLNPLMWDAYERLCDLGASIRPSNVFKESHLHPSFLMAFDTAPPPRPSTQMFSAPDASIPPTQTNPQIEVSQPIDVFNPSKVYVEENPNHGETHIPAKLGLGPSSCGPVSQATLMETPPGLSSDEAILGQNGYRANHASLAEPPMAPLRRSRLQASNVEPQSGADVAKLRSVTVKPRPKEGSGDSTDSQDPKKASLLPPKTTKRTISGNDPNARPPSSLEQAAIGQRRSVRLTKKAPTSNTADGEPDHKKVKATGTRGRIAAASTVGRVISGNRKTLEHPPPENLKQPPPLPANNIPQPPAPPPSRFAPPELLPQRSRTTIDASTSSSSLPALLHLLQPIAQGYYDLAKHNPGAAIATLSALSPHARETPYVLSLLGRAHHDTHDHARSVEHFSRVRNLVPAQTSGMDVFSTALWHLKSDTELAFLSHELIEASRLAPESWCALGNSFSLQRDHDNAIRCFRRATQLDPKNAYSWTLLGHEHVAAEDLEKASLCYRRAVAVEKRHFQGWYGLARVYERLGRLDVAERHYRLASSINPRSAVLTCCIGTIQDKSGNHAAALATYTQAVDLAPGNAIARFKKARALLRARKYDDALEEFSRLKEMAPEEANVHFMLGRVYRAMGNRGAAVRSLSAALGLDPKAAPLIKDAMEALGEEDDEMADAEDEDDEMVD